MTRVGKIYLLVGILIVAGCLQLTRGITPGGSNPIDYSANRSKETTQVEQSSCEETIDSAAASEPTGLMHLKVFKDGDC